MVSEAAANYAGVWGCRIGFGERPALLVIDLMQGYTIEASPLFAAGVVAALPHCAEVIAAARACPVPVVHTNIRYHPDHFADGGVWVRKAPVLRSLVEAHPPSPPSARRCGRC